MRKLFHPTKWLILRKTVAFLSLGGGAVLAYQIHSLNRRFSSLLSDSAIERENEKCDCYIRVSQTIAEVEMSKIVSKLLSVEQMVETLVKGPKSVGNDTNPWHLLRLLQTSEHQLVGDQDRQQALKSLALTNYNVGLAQQIAQACNFKTAVKLARTQGVNVNLFLPPPSLPSTPSSESIAEDLLKLIVSNPPVKETSKCASYFLSLAQKIIEKQKDEEFIFGFDPDTGRINHPDHSSRVIGLYLKALLYQSRSFESSKVLIQHGLLSVLWRLVHHFPENVRFNTMCAQLMANVSLHPQLHEHIFQSGWLGLLAKFMRSEHVSLNLAAGKALANMDTDSQRHGAYDSSVYLLHPLYEDEEDTRTSQLVVTQQQRNPWDMDVIFVHGLLGGVSWTWRQSEVMGTSAPAYTGCWPKDWLPVDVPGIRILGVDYNTSLSQWRSRCPEDVQRSSITTRADEVLVSLKQAGIGRRPIVWIGHSMGGLLVEQLLVTASKSSDPTCSDIARNTKAIYMMSVPHGGSSVATLSPAARFLFLPSVEVDELRKGSNVLDNLNAEFKDFLSRQSTAIVSLMETKTTLVKPWGLELKFVEPSSSDLLCDGEVHYIPVDHFEICKPVNRNSFVYQRLVKLLRDVRRGSPPRELIQPSG